MRARYVYRRRDLVEPDWTRLPGWAAVTGEQWADVQWQRAHCVKNLKQLRDVVGDLLDDRFYADLERDQAERATMSMLIPPQMVNTIVPAAVPDTEAFYADPVRRYMLPVFSDRGPTGRRTRTRAGPWKHEMWTAEGLTHRYPTKVLAELLPTCPQYCGHCTRMDLVGNSTPVIQAQVRPEAGRPSRGHVRLPALPGVRDVVVSGGDVANLPWKNLEAFVARLLEIENIRDIRLATKALMGLPQHWLQTRSGPGWSGCPRPRAPRRADRDPHPRQRGPR